MSFEPISFKNFNKEITIDGKITNTSQMMFKGSEATGELVDYQEMTLEPLRDRRRRIRCVLEGENVGKAVEGDWVEITGILDFDMRKPRRPELNRLIPDRKPYIKVNKITIMD